MVAKKQYCWEIMGCDEEDLCPVLDNRIKCCWEWMEKNSEFQCRNGLCAECIVYLCNNENSVTLEEQDSEKVRRNADLSQQEL